jgi:hypothetical protein
MLFVLPWPTSLTSPGVLISPFAARLSSRRWKYSVINAAMTFSMPEFRRLQEVFRERTHREIDARSCDITHEHPTQIHHN